MLDGIGFEVLAGLAYGGVSIALMVVGFLIADLLTPGRLVTLIWHERRLAPAIHVAASFGAVALIVRQAILSSEDQLVPGLVSTALYGLMGLGLMALAFWLADLVTPGKLGEQMVAEGPIHPAVWITATAKLSVGLVIAAAIS